MRLLLKLKILLLWPLGLMLMGLTGCSGLQALNFVIPKSGYTVTKDIAYGTQPRQFLDVYAPENSIATNDVVVFFYGGSWQEGSKDEYRFVAQALASRGYITVIADYRVYPDAYFPDFVHDGAQAVHWTHNNIAQYGGNTNRIYVAGHSAGAHIAMMLTLNPQYLNAAGTDTSIIHGTIGIAGPYDFLPFTDPNIKALFSRVPDQDTQPIHFARQNTPPILLLHGYTDKSVRVQNTLRLASALRDKGNHVTERIYQDVSHVDIILGVAQGFEGRAPTLGDMTRFMQQY